MHDVFNKQTPCNISNLFNGSIIAYSNEYSFEWLGHVPDGDFC